MRRMWRVAIGLAFAATIGGAPAFAEAKKGVAAVVVPFTPPLNTPLHLRLEKRVSTTRAADVSVVSVVTSDEEIVFTKREPDGYILQWTTMAVNVDAAPAGKATIEAFATAGVGKPLKIQTDATGMPDTLLNIGEVRATRAAALNAALAATDARLVATPEADATRKGVAGMVAMYRDIPDGQLAELPLDEARLIYGVSGVPLVPGTSQPFQTVVALPIANMPINIKGEMTLRSANADTVTIAITSASDEADVKAAVIAFMQSIATKFDVKMKEDAAAAMQKISDFAMQNEQVVTLDARTGMVRGARVVKLVRAAGQTRTETKTFAFGD